MYVWEGSGSVNHEVSGIYKDKNDILTVIVNRLVPEAGTADMAGWAVVVSVDKETVNSCDGFDAVTKSVNV